MATIGTVRSKRISLSKEERDSRIKRAATALRNGALVKDLETRGFRRAEILKAKAGIANEMSFSEQFVEFERREKK